MSTSTDNIPLVYYLWYIEEYVSSKVQEWSSSINIFSDIAKSQPQSAFSALTQSAKQKDLPQPCCTRCQLPTGSPGWCAEDKPDTWLLPENPHRMTYNVTSSLYQDGMVNWECEFPQGMLIENCGHLKRSPYPSRITFLIRTESMVMTSLMIITKQGQCQQGQQKEEPRGSR